MKKILCFILVVLSSVFGYSQNSIEQINAVKIVYKTLDTVSLNLHVFYPEGHKKTDKTPVIIFFHGGGWAGGSYKKFLTEANYFANRGIVAITAEYRIRNKHNTTPFEAVNDAKSAIRYLRLHAAELGIDKNKVIAGGSSAGGHLAAATGNIIGLEEKGEDLTISSKPNALVLLFPVIDNSEEGFGYKRFKERYKEISPMHNISIGAPPTIIFSGTKDKLISVKTIEKYKQKMEAVGSRCDLFLYENGEHGLYGKNEEGLSYKEDVIYKTDAFLVSLNYLKGEPMNLKVK